MFLTIMVSGFQTALTIMVLVPLHGPYQHHYHRPSRPLGLTIVIVIVGIIRVRLAHIVVVV